MGFGIASLTLVSQALGRKESRDAKKWGWEVASIGTAGVIVFSIIVILFPQAVLSIFISDQSTINLALIPLQLLGLWIWIDVFGTIISFSLIGAGATKVVLICKFLFWWGLDLPLRWLVGVHLGYGLEGIFLIPFFVTTMGSSLFSLIWYRERWALIKI
jgi:Na+-driven multidrug efflux pump